MADPKEPRYALRRRNANTTDRHNDPSTEPRTSAPKAAVAAKAPTVSTSRALAIQQPKAIKTQNRASTKPNSNKRTQAPPPIAQQAPTLQMELIPITPIDPSIVPHASQLTADGRLYGRRISLTPEILYAQAQGFLTRCTTKHFLKYGPNGTHSDAEKYSAWQACAAHVQALYARSTDPAVKEELEQFLLDASRGRSGSDLAGWIGRKERGEWSYNLRDPMLLAPGKERTEATARQFAKEIGVENELAAIWGLRRRLAEISVRQKAWEEERTKRGLNNNFIGPWSHLGFDPFMQFEKWQFGVTNGRNSATVCAFMFVACLIAAFIDPEELRKTFAKNRAAIFDLQKVRVDAIHLLKAIAQAEEEEFYQKENQETADWLREWAAEEGRYTYHLVYNETPEETEVAIEKEKQE